MARKETKAHKGKYTYYRGKARHPVTGEYQDVYGKTAAERDEKVDALEAAWAKEIRDEASPYFWKYAADWFARSAPDMSVQRRATVSREINKYICPVIGHIHLAELTSDDVRDCLAARTARSRSARRTTLQIINRILDAAEDAGKISRNPARNVKAGGTKAQKKTALTRSQEQTLLEAVEGQRIRLFVLLCLYTGLRREEACGLRWGDLELDGEAPHLTVRRACRWPNGTAPEVEEYLKSAAGWRTIPIPEILRREFLEEKGRLGDLKPEQLSPRCVIGYADGSPWTLKSFQNAWRVIDARSTGTVVRRRKDSATGETTKVTVEKKLGDRITNHNVYVTIDFDCTPHKLRRTYVTRLILGGMDLRRVQYLAGHESPEITLQIYTDLQDHQPEDLIGDVRAVFDKSGENEGKN